VLFTVYWGRPGDDAGDALLAPIEHPRELKRLLAWLASYPLPLAGGRAYSADDYAHLPAPRTYAATQHWCWYGAFYLLDATPLGTDLSGPAGNGLLGLSTVVADEVGACLTVTDIYERTRAILPELFRRHFGGVRRTW
jgi:hypothetical protein